MPATHPPNGAFLFDAHVESKSPQPCNHVEAIVQNLTAIAFSSEVDAGSREENASKPSEAIML
jgi:hypothetical protein